MKIHLNRFVFLGFLSAIALVFVLGLFSYFYFSRYIEGTTLTDHSRAVLQELRQARSFFSELEISRDSYILTGDSSFLQSYHRSRIGIRTQIKKLDSLIIDKAQRDHLRELVAVVDNYLKVSVLHIKIKGEHHKVDFLQKDLRSKILYQFQLIIEGEEKLLVARREFMMGIFYQFLISFYSLIGSSLTIIVVLMIRTNYNLRSVLQAKQKALLAEKEAKKISSELEAFSYSVSHDLRSPLRSISGFAQMLREDYGNKIDKEGNRLIEVVERNAKRMGQLIDDLLAFSRLGKQELGKAEIDMDALVKSVLEELLDHQKGRKIALDLKPLQAAFGDINMIRQVWDNLISNAIKYSQSKGNSQIIISCYEDMQMGEVVYCVKDNGVGFDMKYIDKLFGVFQRLHKKEEFEGTGVGLALAKRIIDRHKGRIWAEAIVNEGATFYFSLPK